MEYIQIFLVDLPAAIRGVTVRNDDDSYTILINASLSHEMQCEAYDHEISHINNGDFDCMYNADTLELFRHGA